MRIKRLMATVAVAVYLPVAVVNAEEPVLKHVFDIHAECGEPRVVGDIPGGKRVMIPITGGWTKGMINAEILPGGADYQLVDTVSGRVEFDAIYTIKTTDSSLINVRNIGVSSNRDGKPYFTTTPKFEADKKSDYGWLGDRIFVCRPIGFGNGSVTLRVWTVE